MMFGIQQTISEIGTRCNISKILKYIVSIRIPVTIQAQKKNPEIFENVEAQDTLKFKIQLAKSLFKSNEPLKLSEWKREQEQKGINNKKILFQFTQYSFAIYTYFDSLERKEL